MTDSLDRESRLVRDTHMGHVKSNNIAQAHGNFGLHGKTISYGRSVLDTEADTHAFNPITEECVRVALVQQGAGTHL